MEVFSKVLHSRFDAGYIMYHPKTEELGISHLMFADDVMVLFDGGSSSLHSIMEALDNFVSWYGLKMNKDKTQLFLAGVNEVESTTVEEYGFTKGSLPIRYLGLPFMHRKLKIVEYEPLMEKIRGRFLRTKVGNGQSTSFWFDVWTPLGPFRTEGLMHSFLSQGLRGMLKWHLELTSVKIRKGCGIAGSTGFGMDLVCIILVLYSHSKPKTWEAVRPRADSKPWSNSVQLRDLAVGVAETRSDASRHNVLIGATILV
ncbi:unnamed protein product [Microthlaspi erraticum]|uniref:Reverse transcriptase domain-containing protein n=1 Tax=Microthlaspi erraticum TaxID=1685480 RepID=A0A6D2IKK5_9BRAS|nr:unnamed protein product [Microthlaspi erraticum]CAA7034545.1 unnamed protein product [Microthlaspi erraticum]